MKILIEYPSGESEEAECTPENAISALVELRARNPLRNDLDAYKYDLIEWGLGIESKRPIPADFGLEG